MASANKKFKSEITPVEVNGKTMFHLGHQIMVYMDSYNEKHYIRLCKHKYSRNQTNIYPTKAGITISNPEGLDMFQKILNTKSIQDRY